MFMSYESGYGATDDMRFEFESGQLSKAVSVVYLPFNSLFWQWKMMQYTINGVNDLMYEEKGSSVSNASL